jgi:hypothetical protein
MKPPCLLLATATARNVDVRFPDLPQHKGHVRFVRHNSTLARLTQLPTMADLRNRAVVFQPVYRQAG